MDLVLGGEGSMAAMAARMEVPAHGRHSVGGRASDGHGAVMAA